MVAAGGRPDGNGCMRKDVTKVLAVASGGGHWDELMLLRPTLDRYDVRYATTDPLLAEQRGIPAAERLPDCNRHQPLQSIYCGVVAVRLALKHRPDVVISTGAAPGFLCLLAARIVGARTLWIDSVANGEELSMCGKLSRTFAHECWVQWEDLAARSNSGYFGAVL
jgi:UDP-N-acetylglucosamine:LPS N-acetylglucosamine transferase